MTSSACDGPVKTAKPPSLSKSISASTISLTRLNVSGSIPFETLMKYFFQ